jgi:hypothetical protein
MATLLPQPLRRLVQPGAIILVALSCGDGDDGTDPGAEPVATVQVTPASAGIAPGETVQLTATPRDAAGTALTDRDIAWSSNDEAVATVSDAGLVTGVADGEAVITATSEDESGSATISVQAPVATVEVAPPSASILNGETLQLVATARDAAGNPLSDRPVTWTSDAQDVATVSASGVVTGVAPGTATITASAGAHSGIAAITVTVLNVDGDWTFTETFSDPAIDLACTNEADVTLDQDGATFIGTSDQTGECTLEGEPFPNSDTFEITDGTVQGTSIGFAQPGEQVECLYEGTLVDDPPTSASGTVTCTGFLGDFGPAVNATGSWEMSR